MVDVGILVVLDMIVAGDEIPPPDARTFGVVDVEPVLAVTAPAHRSRT
jgi:hypothetical protein